MRQITKKLKSQIRSWQIYSVIAPTIFVLISGVFYVWAGSSFQNIFLSGLVILSVTCVAWWHWSLFTIMSLINIIQESDDTFNNISTQLNSLSDRLNHPNLKIIKSIDKRD